MDIRLNRADCKQLYRLGMLGLAITLAAKAQADAPSAWNVVREPVEPSRMLITEPTGPATLPRPLPTNPLATALTEVAAENKTLLHELPLLPPGPDSASTATSDKEPSANQVATPRQIKPKQVPEGVPANLARVKMQEPRREMAQPAMPDAQPTMPASQPVLAASRPRRNQYDPAIFESTQATAPSPRRTIQPSSIMPGFGSVSLREQAAKHLDESSVRLSHRASLTAGAEAIEALRLVAQAKDLAAQSSDSSSTLEAALTALKEAEDFVDRYGIVDGEAISRMVRAHQTTVLKSFDCSQLTGASAADVYLDTARRILAEMASTDQLAAHAVGCLAKSYRQRSGESRVALAASVHLMRAAVIAVPNDRELTEELASVLNQAELRDEAKHVLALSQRLAPRAPETVVGGPIIAVVSGMRLENANGQATQAVRLEQLTPEAFSQLSRIENGPSGALPNYYQSPTQAAAIPPAANASPRVAQAATVPAQAAPGVNTAEPGVIENQVGNPLTRAVKSVTGIWK